MISIITVLIIGLGSFFYLHIGLVDTLLLVAAGMCVAIGLNWFCRPKNAKGKFNKEDYQLSHEAFIRPFSEGDSQYGGFAQTLNYNGIPVIKILVEDKGTYTPKFIPQDYTSFSLVGTGETPTVKIYGANKLVWGDKAFSIIPARTYSTIFHISIKL